MDLTLKTGNRAKLWDIAAAHAILMGSGGILTDIDGKPIDYKNDEFIIDNGFFAFIPHSAISIS